MRSFDVHFLRSIGRDAPFKCAYVGGTFDCLHRGHLALLATVRKIAHRTVVSVNTDEFAARYKRQPLLPLADRLAVLGQCKLVDVVLVNEGGEDSTSTIAQSGCDCIVHGSDWHAGNGLLEQMGLTAQWLQDHQIQLVTLPYTPWVSTTQLLTAYAQRSA